ncbi:MAG: GspE/PulE family protein [Patescibacteria group bacterium]
MPNKLKLALEEVSSKLSAKMTDIDIVEHERETRLKAESCGMPYINLVNFPIAQEALSLVPEEQAKKFKIIPILLSEGELRIGVVDSEAPGLADYLKEFTKEYFGHYVLYLISQHSFEVAVKHYAGLVKVKQGVAGVAITESDIKKYQGLMKDFTKVNELLVRATVTDMVTIIIAGGMDMSATDIHIEAEETDIKVRYRIDGLLYTVAETKKDSWVKLISRLKLLSKLKINIETKPQDGRFTIFLTKDKIDVRVSTIPTAFGESVVMRLLRSSATGLQFEDLGLQGKAYDILKKQVERPNGLILTSGPTGCGKTTTLYAILNKLNQSDTKIITLEDPIEYKLKGINQSQVDHTKGYDFTHGLKSILRQDPDVVMVGEVRDPETAEIAVNAALTGHLVLSTIHTNSAAGAVSRLLSMGVKSFLLAPSLNAVIGQRLVRRLCPKCKQETKLDGETENRVRKILAAVPKNSGYQVEMNKLKFYEGKGCQACGKLGYKGRIGIYEILTVTPEIEKVILETNAAEQKVEELAIACGMVTMVQDGVLKALQGITSLTEVFAQAE